MLGALVLTLPIYLVIALIVKLSDWRAPIFFKQERIGKNGVPFNMYKFRTMQVDAETKLEELLDQNEIEGAMFKMKNDPRVTKVGYFLRKTSLDELPQLWNVVRGEMSLIGPRPPLPNEVAMYNEYEMGRLKITPGCTGLWQVSGRNELSFQEMVELDLIYIEELSFKLDLKIFFKTFLVIFFPKGAY